MGVWLHNYLWAQLHPGAMTELYWWKDNINSQPGPDGSSENGLYEVYKYYADFISNIPLNSGTYQNAQATLSSSNLRVVGQKDITNNRAHLWVQNTNHTWKRVVDGNAGSGLGGTVSIAGFTTNQPLNVEWHSFTTQGSPTVSTSTVTPNSNGSIAIELPKTQNLTDIALKIGDYTNIEPPDNPGTDPDTEPGGDADGESKGGCFLQEISW
jgi:hypothetical protein